jgi:hypothetical protein
MKEEVELKSKAVIVVANMLRNFMLRLGAEPADISIELDEKGAKLMAMRSVGASSEFGDRRRPALRRLSRSIEELRRGDVV